MKRKRIIILAHYYHPDTASTGQILRDLAEGMKDNFEVTVICTVPSYEGVIEEKYTKQRFYHEIINGVNVVRVRVPEFSKANKISRIKNIVSYFFNALSAIRKTGKQDYIFTISQPPILGGLLGVCGKKIKKAKLVYCIQDYNPEQVMAVGYSKNKLLLNVMMWLDKYSCKKSDLVITVGRDLVDTLKRRFKNSKVPNHVLINNWIDEKEVYPLPPDNLKVKEFKDKYNLQNKFVIMYSGNLGLYYDLENLMKIIAKFKPGTKASDGREIAFVFVGAGSVLDKLISYKEEKKLENVYFIPYQKKEELIYSLNAGDVHWCVNSKGIKGVSCPSKFYGIAAVGKPVLGVLEEGSEIRMLIEETGCGLVCNPGEYEIIEKNIKWFIEHAVEDEVEKMGRMGYIYLIQHLTKSHSIEEYIKQIDKL